MHAGGINSQKRGRAEARKAELGLKETVGAWA
jgi:hypothetical protein